jgi:hypothetical protein
MGLQVGNVTRGYLNNRMRSDDPERSVTLSMRLTEGQYAKLLFLAERFGDSKAGVAQKLLDASMEDAMRSMGSYEVDENVDPDEANRIIDRIVEGYREEIRQVFEREIEKPQRHDQDRA